MAIPTINQQTVKAAADNIIQGHPNSALERLEKLGRLDGKKACGLTDEQKAKIKTFFLDSENLQIKSPKVLIERINVALSTETIDVVPSQPSPDFICFMESQKSGFANNEPCQITMDGKNYKNATEYYNTLMKQFPKQQDLCIKQMLKAKFEQHPELTERLVATGSAYLVFQSHDDGFWSDGFNGTGENKLGEYLMWLRGEYTGIGVVKVPATYGKMLECQKERGFNVLPLDIINQIFDYYVSQRDFGTLGQLARANKFFQSIVTKFAQTLELKKHCPNLKIILDAKAQGIEVDDEPPINRPKLIKQYRVLQFSGHANAADLTLLTVCKGSSLEKLKRIANEAGITVNILEYEYETTTNHQGNGEDRTWQTISPPADNVRKSYRVLITGISDFSANNPQNQAPNLIELFTLCIYTQKIDKQGFGDDPNKMVLQNTSTKNWVIVWSPNNTPHSLCICHSDRLVLEFAYYIKTRGMWDGRIEGSNIAQKIS